MSNVFEGQPDANPLSLAALFPDFDWSSSKFKRVQYHPAMDWLFCFSVDEDCGYVAEPLIPNTVDILWNFQQDAIIGIKLWGVAHSPNGQEILQNAGLLL